MPDYEIKQGATFRARLLWMQPTLTVKAVTAVANSIRPALTATGHGIPVGIDWPLWIRGVKGMAKVNNDADDIGDQDKARWSSASDANTITLQIDTTDLGVYTSGGEIAYQPPVDMTGSTARMQIRKRLADAAPVLSLLSSTASPDSRLTITPAAGVIDIEISATDTEAIDWSAAVWDMEVVHADGSVTRVASGRFVLSKEVTRP